MGKKKLNRRNNNGNSNGVSSNTSEYYADKLAFIGAAVSTLGDFLQTVAAALALEESIASDNIDQMNQQDQEDKMSRMQKQIDELTIQLNQMKKR